MSLRYSATPIVVPSPRFYFHSYTDDGQKSITECTGKWHSVQHVLMGA